jgi:toxin-antitoxin system PIN domain toxin
VKRHLLDANVLIALLVSGHVHHRRASAWLARSRPFAVCPVTEGALTRFLIREGAGGAAAKASLDSLHAHPEFAWWPDSVSYRAVDLAAVRGHRQVTDAYLAQLARSHGGALATLDRGLAEAHPDVAVLLPD